MTTPTLPEFATEVLGLDLSEPQECLLYAIAGMDIPDHLQEHIFSAHWCKGARPPKYEARNWMEILLLCGVRSGKDDYIASTVAVYEALFNKPKTSEGEVPWVAILAQGKKSGRIAFRYCLAKLRRVARYYECNPMVGEPRNQEIMLTNGAGIGIWPSNVKGIRGETVFCGIADEVAHWWDADEYKNPAREVLESLRTRMATIDEPKLLMLTTPYAKGGVVFDLWRRRQELAEQGDTLVFHATTEAMNPRINMRALAKAKREDENNYKREYLAQFTDAISAFIAWSDLEPCVMVGVESVPRGAGKSHMAAMDSTAGRKDDWTLAIGHSEGDVCQVDRLIGWTPAEVQRLSVTGVLNEAAEVCKQYGVQLVWSDSYGFEYIKDGLATRGITAKEFIFSQPSKAKMYLGFKAKIQAGNYRMPDHRLAIGQLVQLEERLTAGGGRKYDAPAGGHDDYADVCALLAHQMGATGEYRVRRLR